MKFNFLIDLTKTPFKVTKTLSIFGPQIPKKVKSGFMQLLKKKLPSKNVYTSKLTNNMICRYKILFYEC